MTHRTILVVDDEASIQILLARQLRQLGYEVQTAGSGAAALELLRLQAGPYDLVLTDILMPAMNGTELAARLLERDPLQAVVLMSGSAPSGVADIGSGPGLPVLKKPIDVATLARTLEQALATAVGLT